VGKEDPVEFDSNLTWRSNMRGVEYVGDLSFDLGGISPIYSFLDGSE